MMIMIDYDMMIMIDYDIVIMIILIGNDDAIAVTVQFAMGVISW